MKHALTFWMAGCAGLLLLLCTLRAPAQGVIPVQRYTAPKLLNRTPAASSFAYSLRKIRNGYAGYALRVRKGTGTSIAEADLSFDGAGLVSDNSSVTVTSAGSGSGFTVGQVLSFSTFRGAQSVFVKIWYDQGTNAYHATQNTEASQPQLVLNSAGSANNKPSLLFDGTKYLDVGQPIQNLVQSGINGSFLLWTKPTANANQDSFGYWSASSTPAYRWSIHLNWSNGNVYFDAETCCSNPSSLRSVSNSGSLNLFKQYSFVRGASYKTLRIQGAATSLNNTTIASTSASGGGFYIGWVFNGADSPYQGNLCEALLFPADLDVSGLSLLENDQINFWGN
ncbi:MAG: hypothetical protein ACTHLE_25235 [Agriterribacter sp.]